MTRTKRTWPLFLIAAGAFLPGLGILFASIALTWALVSDRPRAMLAAVVAAVGGVLNLAAIALMVWYTEDDPAFAAANAASARRDLERLVVAIEDYRVAAGEYPASLAVFTRFPHSLKFINVTDASAGTFTIPHNYQYARSADGRRYDLYGVGLDGKPGTADDVRPDLPDTLARRAGYRPRP